MIKVASLTRKGFIAEIFYCYESKDRITLGRKLGNI